MLKLRIFQTCTVLIFWYTALNHFTLSWNTPAPIEPVKLPNNRAEKLYIGEDMGPYQQDYVTELHANGAVTISVCNQPKYHFCDFLYSAQSHGALVHLVNFGKSHKLNTDKLRVLEQTVSNYSNETIIVFADCFDVIFNNNFGQMIRKFRETGHRFLISAEYMCYPDSIIESLIPNRTVVKGDCKLAYRTKSALNKCVQDGPNYANSGTYIAYAGELKSFIADVKTKLKGRVIGSDQKFFHEAYLANLFGATLDHCVDFFMCMLVIEALCGTSCPLVVRKKDHLEFRARGSRPFMVHFDGSSKRYSYRKYINDTLTRLPSKYDEGAKLLWVNREPRKITDFCK